MNYGIWITRFLNITYRIAKIPGLGIFYKRSGEWMMGQSEYWRFREFHFIVLKWTLCVSIVTKHNEA